MAVALIHFIGLAAALCGLVPLAARRSAGAAFHPRLVIASLLALIGVTHLLIALDHLGIGGLGRVIDYCRLLSPLFWVFLIYAWLRGEDAARIESAGRKLATLIDRMPVLLDAFDERGEIALWNRECERVTGYTAGEIVGNGRAMELLYPDPGYRARMMEQWMARPGSYRDWQWELTCKDGSRRTIAWSNVSNEVPIEPWRWWGVGVDVTEKARAAARLSESEARFRMFMDNSPAESFIKDETGRYLFGNQAWARQFGKPPGELLGKRDAELWPAEVARLFGESDEAIRRTGKAIHVEEPGPIVDGRQTWFDVYKFPVPVEPGRTLVGGIVLNITDRKLAAAQIDEWRNRFEAAINSSQQLLYDWNAVTNEVVVAGAVERMLGCPASELETLERWESRIHPDDLPGFHEEIRRVIATRQPFNLEYRMRRPDGTHVHIEDHGYFFSDAGGSLTRMIGFAADITRRKQTEQQQQQLEAQLVQTQRLEAVGNLAAGIAHDFSNLLTAIAGHLALTYRALPTDHPARKSLQTIEKAAEQGVAMTRSLLTFANRTPSAKQPCDLRSLMRESIQIFRHLLPAGIEIQFEGDESDSPWARASPSQFQQALMNLILNARDAMPSGGTLRLGVRSRPMRGAAGRGPRPEGGRREAVVSVEDSGVGMDEQTLAHMFEPFFTTKERHKGTGLGLSVVHGIMTDHGGTISVESRPGRGTRFEITLPSCEAAGPAEKAAEVVVPPATRRRGVLLMHQADYVREIIVTALESVGFGVLLCEAPEQVSRVLRERGNEVGVVVIAADDLPGEAADHLTEMQGATGSMPMIVLASNTAQFLDEPSRANRFIIPKPFLMSQLIELVHRVLGLSKAG